MGIKLTLRAKVNLARMMSFTTETQPRIIKIKCFGDNISYAQEIHSLFLYKHF